MPLQYMVTSDAVARTSRYADAAKEIMFNPVGQIVGRLNQVKSVKDVIEQMVEDYVAATERLANLGGLG
jgi:NAD(P)H-dependent flavin oxidoreductase YrpB (nitropropane dioxygenase family)